MAHGDFSDSFKVDIAHTWTPCRAPWPRIARLRALAALAGAQRCLCAQAQLLGMFDEGKGSLVSSSGMGLTRDEASCPCLCR